MQIANESEHGDERTSVSKKQTRLEFHILMRTCHFVLWGVRVVGGVRSTGPADNLDGCVVKDNKKPRPRHRKCKGSATGLLAEQSRMEPTQCFFLILPASVTALKSGNI